MRSPQTGIPGSLIPWLQGLKGSVLILPFSRGGLGGPPASSNFVPSDVWSPPQVPRPALWILGHETVWATGLFPRGDGANAIDGPHHLFLQFRSASQGEVISLHESPDDARPRKQGPAKTPMTTQGTPATQAQSWMAAAEVMGRMHEKAASGRPSRSRRLGVGG